MEVNTTIDQLTPEGAKLFTQAVDKAYMTQGAQQAYKIFSTVKQPKVISDKIFSMSSPQEIEDYRSRGYRFFDDPPFVTNEPDKYPWVTMTEPANKKEKR